MLAWPFVTATNGRQTQMKFVPPLMPYKDGEIVSTFVDGVVVVVTDHDQLTAVFGGIGTGALYAAIALGVVLTFKGSGVVNKLVFESYDNDVAATTLAVTADLSDTVPAGLVGAAGRVAPARGADIARISELISLD